MEARHRYQKHNVYSTFGLTGEQTQNHHLAGCQGQPLAVFLVRHFINLDPAMQRASQANVHPASLWIYLSSRSKIDNSVIFSCNSSECAKCVQ